MKFKVGDAVSSFNGPYDNTEKLIVLATNGYNKIQVQSKTDEIPEWWKEDYFEAWKDSV